MPQYLYICKIFSNFAAQNVQYCETIRIFKFFGALFVEEHVRGAGDGHRRSARGSLQLIAAR